MHHLEPVMQDHFVMFYDDILFHTILNKLLAIDYIPGFSGIPEEDTSLPGCISILNTYPNPFNAATTIRFTLPQSRDVTLFIYDILGRRVKTLVDQYLPAGSHSFVFNASGLTSGIYFARLESNNATKSAKMLLLR